MQFGKFVIGVQTVCYHSISDACDLTYNKVYVFSGFLSLVSVFISLAYHSPSPSFFTFPPLSPIYDSS